MNSEVAPIWTHIESETKKAYAAFCLYRDMGPERSIKKVRLQLGRPEGYLRTLELWSRKYSWVARAKAYDQRNDQIADQTKVAVIVDRETELMKRRETLKEVGWEMASQLFEKAKQMLQFPITRVTRKDSESPDGKVIHMTIIEPAKWSLRDIGRMADIANKIARLSVDLPTEILDITGDLMMVARRKDIDLLPILKELHNQLSEV